MRQYATGFDVDEHVELWIENRGKNGVPSTARELIEDAEAICDMENGWMNFVDIEKAKRLLNLKGE